MQQFFGKQYGDNDAIRAECLFTAFLLKHSIPLSVSDHVGPLLRKMFSKCDFAKRYGCARTKTTMIVGKMAGHAQECVVSALKRRVFAVATDGSNDSQAQLYPIVATFFAEESGLIESKLLTISTLEGPSTGRVIAKLIMDCFASLNVPLSNCIAFCCDNANVMMGNKNGIAAGLTEAHESIVKIGCPCHLINIAAEKAASCLPAKVHKSLWTFFII